MFNPRSLEYTGELWSKFPFLADKVEKAADSNKDCCKYDIYIISRISNLHISIVDFSLVHSLTDNTSIILSLPRIFARTTDLRKDWNYVVYYHTWAWNLITGDYTYMYIYIYRQIDR